MLEQVRMLLERNARAASRTPSDDRPPPGENRTKISHARRGGKRDGRRQLFGLNRGFLYFYVKACFFTTLKKYSDGSLFPCFSA